MQSLSKRLQSRIVCISIIVRHVCVYFRRARNFLSVRTWNAKRNWRQPMYGLVHHGPYTVLLLIGLKLRDRVLYDL